MASTVARISPQDQDPQPSRSRTRGELSSRLGLVVGLVLGLLLVGAPAQAFSLYAAYWDTSDLGEAGGVGISFAFGGKIALEIAGTYYEELDEDPLDLLEEGDSPFVDEGFQVIPIDAGLLWRAGTGLGGGFYLGAGATLFMIDTDAQGVSSDDESGWYVKAGYEFGNSRDSGFFVEALLRRVDAEVGSDLGFLDEPAAIEIDLEGISFHVGFRF